MCLILRPCFQKAQSSAKIDDSMFFYSFWGNDSVSSVSELLMVISRAANLQMTYIRQMIDEMYDIMPVIEVSRSAKLRYRSRALCVVCVVKSCMGHCLN